MATVLVGPGDGGSGSGLQQGSQAFTYSIYQIMGITSSHSCKWRPNAVLHAAHPRGPSSEEQRPQQPLIHQEELVVYRRPRVPEELLPRSPAGSTRVQKPVPPEERQCYQPGRGGESQTSSALFPGSHQDSFVMSLWLPVDVSVFIYLLWNTFKVYVKCN